MPVRDVETFFPARDEPGRVLANRGANGIDGTVSTALGAALAAPETRTFLLTGELALLHDLGGLAAARRAGSGLTIVCVNNGGGGIFDFLPVAEQADSDTYEDHIATPVEIDLATVAVLGGLHHHVVSDAPAVREHLKPGALVEFRTDRATSLARHRELAARIVKRLES